MYFHVRGKQSIRLSAGCNEPGGCPDPHTYENWQAITTCQKFYSILP